MKKVFILLFLALLTININCGGGGGGSATFKSGKTTVKINLGEIRTASQASGGFHTASSTIPSNVTSIRFTISAPDMTTIIETVPVAGQTTITKTFDVPNGPNRHVLVEAINEAINPPDNVSYKGETYANLDGTPVTLTIVMVSTDKSSPLFGGLVSATATSTTTIDLSWSPATDNVTPQNNIQYLIYMATSSGGQNFSSPSFTTSQGATTFTVPGLSPSTTYFFVIRAMDERGLIDSNTVEKSATTFAPPDTTPPSFGGLVSATAVSSTEILLEWVPATDNVSDPSHIDYLIYKATTSGGQNFAVPNAASAPGATSFTMSELAPDTTYYFVVRARDEAYNVDGNTVEKSAITKSLPDTTPPSFSGLVSATALSPNSIRLSWNPATDNVTPSSEISYYVYMSTVSKGQNFSSPKDVVIGSTSATISSLTPGTTYYSIVRAADKLGNFENNTVEKSATTLVSTFIDLEPTSVIINDIFCGSPSIHYYLDNNGTAVASNVLVYVEYGDGYSSDCTPYTWGGLVPGSPTADQCISTAYTPTQYRIIVDPFNTISESNETNNCKDSDGIWCSFAPPASCP